MTYEGLLSRLEGTELQINLSAQAGTSEDESEYGQFIDFANDVLLVYSPEPVYCGEMVMLIQNENTFLHFDEDIEMIYLQPDRFHGAGVYKDSKLIFLMDQSP